MIAGPSSSRSRVLSTSVASIARLVSLASCMLAPAVNRATSKTATLRGRGAGGDWASSLAARVSAAGMMGRRRKQAPHD